MNDFLYLSISSMYGKVVMELYILVHLEQKSHDFRRATGRCCQGNLVNPIAQTNK